MKQPGQNTIKDLQNWIDRNLRQINSSTGKLIKINTYKWNKSKLIYFIENYHRCKTFKVKK